MIEKESTDKKITNFYLRDVLRMKELADKHGGEIESHLTTNKQQADAIEEIKKIAAAHGIRIEIESPEITGLSYKVVKPIYACEFSSLPFHHMPEFNRPKFVPEKALGWWGRERVRVSKLFKKRKKWKKGDGVSNLDGLIDNLHTRAAKNEMNEILQLAEVDARFTFTKEQIFIEKCIYKKNKLKQAIVDFWNALRGY